MAVQNLKELINKVPQGEVTAVSYVQGLVDGMLSMESLHHKERKTPFEFCNLHQAYKSVKPVRNPAYRTKELVEAWENAKQPMNSLAVDMILAFLTAQYSC